MPRTDHTGRALLLMRRESRSRTLRVYADLAVLRAEKRDEDRTDGKD